MRHAGPGQGLHLVGQRFHVVAFRNGKQHMERDVVAINSWKAARNAIGVWGRVERRLGKFEGEVLHYRDRKGNYVIVTPLGPIDSMHNLILYGGRIVN